MKTRSKIVLLFTLVLSFGALLEINADPIRITGGQVNYNLARGGFRSGGGSLQGNNLSFSWGEPDGSSQPLPPNCTGAPSCQPGMSFDLDDGRIFVSNLRGSHTIPPGIVLSSNPLSGTLNIVFLQSVTIPDIVTDNLKVSIPFAMTGDVTFTTFPPNATTVFSSLIEGNGIATLNFDWGTNGNVTGYQLTSYTFVFASPTPEPVPEPATLLLLGAGLAGIAKYGSRYRKQNMIG